MSQEHYSDEKVDIEAGLPVDSSTQLKQTDQLNAEEHDVPQQQRKLSTTKKLLLGGLAGFFIFSAARACHSRHHQGGLQKWSGDWEHGKFAPSVPNPWEYEKEKWSYVEKPTPAIFDAQVSDDLRTSTAAVTFGLLNKRPLTLNFTNVADGSVVVSRQEDLEEPKVTIESTIITDLNVTSESYKLIGKKGDLINIVGVPESVEIVRLALPKKTNKIRALSIVSTDRISISLDASANDVRIKNLLVDAKGDVALDEVVAKRATVLNHGDITGTFNVTSLLRLETLSGDINATINIVEKHKHKDKEPKKPEEPEDDHEDEKPTARSSERPCGLGKRFIRWFGLDFGDDKRKHPKPPKFAVVDARSIAGSIHLHVHKPKHVPARLTAHATSGDVTIKGPKTFFGHFFAASQVGEVEVNAEDDKEIKVMREKKTESGRLLDGFVRFHDQPWPKPHHGSHPPGPRPHEGKHMMMHEERHMRHGEGHMEMHREHHDVGDHPRHPPHHPPHHPPPPPPPHGPPGTSDLHVSAAVGDVKLSV